MVDPPANLPPMAVLEDHATPETSLSVRQFVMIGWQARSVAGVLTLLSCGGYAFRTLVSAPAPDGEHSVIVLSVRHGPDSSVWIEGRDGKRLERIYSDKRDGWPFLADVAWTPDSLAAFVLVCDRLNPPFLVGYHFARRGHLSLADTASHIRTNLLRRYSPDESTLAAYKGDIISWACDATSQALPQFRATIGDSMRLPPLSTARPR